MKTNNVNGVNEYDDECDKLDGIAEDMDREVLAIAIGTEALQR